MAAVWFCLLARQLLAQQNSGEGGGETYHDRERDVRKGEACRAGAGQNNRLRGESGEGGEAAEESKEEGQPHGWTNPSRVDARKKPEQKAAGHVDQKSGPRESARRAEEAPHQIAQRTAYGTTGADPEDILEHGPGA